MVCPNCGAVNADNNTFCEQCGAGLAQAQQPTAAYAPNPAVEAVKRLGASKLFLVAAILLSVTLLFNCINAIAGGDDAFAQITTAADQLGVGDAFGALDQQPSVLGTLLGMLPSILIAVGVWMTYVAAANTTTSSMKTFGLTMIKVIMIISLVAICVLTVIAEIFLAIAAGAISQLGDSDAMTVGGAILTIVQVALIPAIALVIVYIALMLSTINKVKKTVTTGFAYYKASGFVAVMNFLSALGALSGAFGGSAFQAIASLCSAAALVLFGILIFQYRSTLRPIAEMQMMPPAAPYAPVAPTAPVAPSAPAAEPTAAPTQDTQE